MGALDGMVRECVGWRRGGDIPRRLDENLPKSDSAFKPRDERKRRARAVISVNSVTASHCSGHASILVVKDIVNLPNVLGILSKVGADLTRPQTRRSTCGVGASFMQSVTSQGERPQRLVSPTF
jgi:hypothetical protein